MVFQVLKMTELKKPISTVGTKKLCTVMTEKIIPDPSGL
jgi:hypothetical protein